jgi:hypothetical protein
MTFVDCITSFRDTCAYAVGTLICSSAFNSVVTRITVVGGGIGTLSRRSIASSNDMALVRRRTDDGICAGANSRITHVGLRAGVAIITCNIIVGSGIRTRSRRSIASSNGVTLVRRGANHGI